MERRKRLLEENRELERRRNAGERQFPALPAESVGNETVEDSGNEEVRDPEEDLIDIMANEQSRGAHPVVDN